jgi:ADP-ribosyl-[dinitrogen reductase] hydrolase
MPFDTLDRVAVGVARQALPARRLRRRASAATLAIMLNAASRLCERLHDIAMVVGESTCDREASPLCAYSPFAPIAAADKQDFVAAAARDPGADRAMGCMVGMAVGDALGHPLEFLPVVDEPGPGAAHFDLDRMQYHDALNRFRLQPGQWTDDTAMGLCIADSLIIRRQYDGSDLRARFWNWWFRGYDNAFRHDPTRRSSVGLGGNIARSLRCLEPGVPPPPRYEANTEDAGIGSLMRLAAIPIFHHRSLPAARAFGHESSLTTHPGPIAAQACAFLSYAIAQAIRQGIGGGAPSFLEEVTADYLALLAGMVGDGRDELRALLESRQPDDGPERCWNWKAETLDITGTLGRRGKRYHGYDVDPGYFGAYCLDGLAVALHAVHHTRSFAEAVVSAINHLGDADSTGAVAGQLAGALYGHARIDPRLTEQLRPWDDGEIALRGALLYQLAPA